MSYLAPSTSPPQSTERPGQGAIVAKRGESQGQRYAFFSCCPHQLMSMAPRDSLHTASIHILDDDSLLHIFYLYRPPIFDGDMDDEFHLVAGQEWDCERWWYGLAQVCRRWRNLILGSAPYLRLCLVCTHGTPVADMLAHSPPFPLFIDYLDAELDIAEEEEDIILALEQRDRVRRVRIRMPLPIIQKLVAVIEGEYPVLEYLIMTPSTNVDSTASILSETLHAPHLRHLTLRGFTLPTGSRLLTTAVGIVTLCLFMEHRSAYFQIQPHTLLRWLSFLPQLETLRIDFFFPTLNGEVESQLMHTPIMTHVTFPNLRRFEFQGASAYLEAVVSRITAPRLEKLRIQLILQLSLTVPGLLQFMSTTENLRFDSATFEFSRNHVFVKMYLRESAEGFALSVTIFCWDLDIQVTCVAQMFNSLSQRLSPVEHLALEFEDSFEYDGPEFDRTSWRRTEWRKLLRSFGHVKNLHVDEELAEVLSHCLQPEGGEPSREPLPELRRLTCLGSSRGTDDVFTSFIDARQKEGRPVLLICPRPRSASPLSRSSSQSSSESSSIITSESSEAESGSSENGSSEVEGSEVESSEMEGGEAEESEAWGNETGSSEAGSSE